MNNFIFKVNTFDIGLIEVYKSFWRLIKIQLNFLFRPIYELFSSIHTREDFIFGRLNNTLRKHVRAIYFNISRL